MSYFSKLDFLKFFDFLQTIQHDHPPTWLLVITPLVVIIAIPTAYYLFLENEKILKNFVLKNQTL